MSEDRGEAIMARLAVIARELPGVATGTRNALEVSDRKLPAAIVLEGDETPATPDGAGRPAHQMRLLTRKPQICILSDKKPEELGPDLAKWRALFIVAVLFDAELITLVGPNGAINYHGFETDLALGRDMLGAMALKFAFTYWFDPRKL